MQSKLIHLLVSLICISNCCLGINQKYISSAENAFFKLHSESGSSSSSVANDWGMEKIDLYDAWDIETGDDDVRVGVVDTGIDNHMNLVNNLTATNNGTVTLYAVWEPIKYFIEFLYKY